MIVSAPLAKNNLARFTTIAAASTVDGAYKKMRTRGAIRAGKDITLAISNEYIDDIISIIKLLDNSDVLVDGVSQRVKHKATK